MRVRKERIILATALALILVTSAALAYANYTFTWAVTAKGTEAWTDSATRTGPTWHHSSNNFYPEYVTRYLYPSDPTYDVYGYTLDYYDDDGSGWISSVYLNHAANRLEVRLAAECDIWVLVCLKWGDVWARFKLYSKKYNEELVEEVTIGSGTVNFGDGKKDVGDYPYPLSLPHGGYPHYSYWKNGPTYAVTDNSAHVDTWLDKGDVYAKLISQKVSIDIKPGSDPNAINPNSNGLIPVAILTTDAFDATMVDPSTVTFGPNCAKMAHKKAHQEDVDGDGDTDLLLHFKCQDTGIASGDTTALLTGKLNNGSHIHGVDSIKTAGN